MTINQTPLIEIEFIVGDIREELPRLSVPFDRVFHDPFSPHHVPALWSVDLFREYHRLLRERNGLLLTYSSAAAVRGGLKEAGFTIGKTVPIGRNSGGTAAWLQPFRNTGNTDVQDFLSVSPLEDDYINSWAGIPYRDSVFNNSNEAILNNRLIEQQQSNRSSGAAIRRQMDEAKSKSVVDREANPIQL